MKDSSQKYLQSYMTFLFKYHVKIRHFIIIEIIAWWLEYPDYFKGLEMPAR